jgi:hypothetical protein
MQFTTIHGGNMKPIIVLFSIVSIIGCAQTHQNDEMTNAKIKQMSTMRNPECREVGSYLYCNER